MCLTGQQTHLPESLHINIWDIVKMKIRNTKSMQSTKSTFTSITPLQYHRLIAFIPWHIDAVLLAKGDTTNYWDDIFIVYFKSLQYLLIFRFFFPFLTVFFQILWQSEFCVLLIMINKHSDKTSLFELYSVSLPSKPLHMFRKESNNVFAIQAIYWVLITHTDAAEVHQALNLLCSPQC